VKGPEPLLKSLNLSFMDPVRTYRAARIDSLHRAWIGHDVFYFVTRDSREHFLHDPLKYAHMLSDPVSQRRFHPTAKSPRLEYRGRPYYFETDATLARFRGNPGFYALRGPMDEAQPMRPMPGHAGH
jgi:YHS domain-containing protein